jgi:SAM-dependent methyltransferase
MSQYDGIAQAYQQTTQEEISRLYIENPNMLRTIGSVVGLDVLGVGCGDGYLERMLKQAGASRVVGTDLSPGMLNLGRISEKELPLGIEYFQHDLTQLPALGAFDIATAKYVFNYAQDRTQLLCMCQSIFRNLKPGGRLVAMVPDYDAGLPTDTKYGFCTEAIDNPLLEGGKMSVTLYADGQPGVSFQVHYWRKATYEQALQQAGFRSVIWHTPVPSKEAIERYGQEFWQDWLKQPFSAVIEANK